MAHRNDYIFTGNPLDRAQLIRRDGARLRRLARSGEAGFLILSARKALVNTATRTLVWLKPEEAGKRGEPVFLGLTPDGRPRFARAVDVDTGEELRAVAGKDAAFLDLRSLATGGLLGSGELAILAHAKPLLCWHENHPYCARCGAPTHLLEGGASRGCGKCGARHFPRTDPAVIMLVHHGDHCLLARNAHLPPGMFSTLAGFVDQGETVEEAVRREVMEETGVHVSHVHYHSSQPWPFPSSLMIGCFAGAQQRNLAIDPHELEEAHWFSRADIKRMFDTTAGEGPYISPPFSIAHHLIRHFADATGIFSTT